MGVDPGLTRLGVGVVEGTVGRPLSLVEVDVIRTPADLDPARRLAQLADDLQERIERLRPDAVAVERVFSQHNVRTVMGTAQASGVAMMLAARHGIGVHLHTPSEVKAAVTGSGRADKEQVAQMVTRVLRLSEAPRPADAADALALAICHVWRGGAQNRLQDAIAKAGAR
ncbi:crossover junction endodeoxyribonuclease RuvC [Aeromicrobium sp. CTD01-1L150]|uniref:crossover junction endodeoxyribonuclease RuvC n=1 Tax=Aeromicrobium sp. CTD01-1L150 TaxID=3341830 RepID=UPI0035C005AF